MPLLTWNVLAPVESSYRARYIPTELKENEEPASTLPKQTTMRRFSQTEKRLTGAYCSHFCPTPVAIHYETREDDSGSTVPQLYGKWVPPRSQVAAANEEKAAMQLSHWYRLTLNSL